MKSLFFILFSTFLVGMATGVFVYFVSGLSEPLIDLGGDELTSGFEITGDTYGGCQMLGVCPSYHINEQGQYIFIVLRREGEDERREGTLSPLELKELKSRLKEAPLGSVANSSFTGACPIAFDGLAYVFEVRVGEDSYRIDTCEHDTKGEALFDLLIEYFSSL